MESAYNKNQLLRNKLERYVFLRSPGRKIVELPMEMCRGFSKGSTLFEIPSEMRVEWMSFVPRQSRARKDVLALMHTVRGKIVNRITWNVMGMHGEFSCSFSVVRRTWFYEIVHDACRGTLTDIFRISVVAGELDLRARWSFTCYTRYTTISGQKRNHKTNH